MPEQSPYEKMLRESLKDELKLLNAHLPCQQKSLADLLGEEYPGVACSDGSTHIFKKKELAYLAGLVEKDRQEKLMLPIIIEVNPGQDEMAVVCRGEGEGEVVAAVLGMPVTVEQGRIRLYGPQLAALRKVLKTTSQYLFSPRILQ